MSTVKEKETRLSIRVNPQELEHLKQLASDAHMTLADWVRMQLLGHGDELAQLKKEMNTLNERLSALESRAA